MTRNAGDRIYDRRRHRTVVLVFRTNPVGPVPAYWVVQNDESGRKSVIRENRLDEDRWSDA